MDLVVELLVEVFVALSVDIYHILLISDPKVIATKLIVSSNGVRWQNDRSQKNTVWP